MKTIFTRANPKVMKRTYWVRVALITTTLILLFVGLVGLMVHVNKDRLLAQALEELNKGFRGQLAVEGTHISPFQNFPYISIDLENLQIFENKDGAAQPIAQVRDAYLGFDLWSIISGTYEIKKIKLNTGFIKLVQYPDGAMNIVNAFANDDTGTDIKDEREAKSSVNLDLQGIELIDVDFLKVNEEKNILVEAFVKRAESTFRTVEGYQQASLAADFVFNLLVDADTSLLKNKRVTLQTAIDFNPNNRVLAISPSRLIIEQALFLMEGTIDVDDDMLLDLSFKGEKPNFDLFLAFLPPQLSTLAGRYDNGGTIYFDATVVGPSINGKTPNVEIDFGFSEAYIHNLEAKKEINDLSLKGHFTNGSNGDARDAVLTIEDFSAKPETGNFNANITVKNFESPDIDIQLTSDFNLEFLAEFLNVDNLQNIGGNVALKMNFRDIIDLDQPEKTIERLDESYFTELQVSDLSFQLPNYPLAFDKINIQAQMDGHEATIEQFQMRVGKSDIDIKASISDLPAIIHHTDLPVLVDLEMSSRLLDFTELTSAAQDSSTFNEQIKEFSTRLKFESTARSFTESPNLPIGEFFIERLNAQLSNYPHGIHDFYFDVMIDSTDFRVIDFHGMIDNSDFHFDGRLTHYDLWFDEVPQGKTNVDFHFKSSNLQLRDLFSYNGENYVPEDYRQESFQNLVVRGASNITFDKKLQSARLSMEEVEAYMPVHDMRFEDFSGQFMLDSSRVVVSDFGGTLGNSQLMADLIYFLDDDPSEAHSLTLRSHRLDFDQLFSYTPPTSDDHSPASPHEAAFNIFELPFANLQFAVDIDQMNYHRYLLKDFSLYGDMTTDHFVAIDTMDFQTAGGRVALNGYFNGSDPQTIYFSPNMAVQGIDLEQFLFKFENFGQDQLVSENLSGQLFGDITGRIHMHPDMVPSVDDSELHLDIEVRDGSLKNFAAFEALSSYFTDKNLSLIRFDTLRNEFHLKDGTINIPSMNINTSLGYFELSGKQSLNQEMEYYVRIPWKVIARASAQKLFGSRGGDNSSQEDEIQYRDETKRTRFLNVKISGTPEAYDISLEKVKKGGKD